MFTGQISSHALQLVHAHSSSAVMRSNSELAPIVISGSVPSGGDTTGVAGGRHHLAGLEHDLARVERLAGGVGRAHARAAAAHRAGVGVEQLLPREVLDHRRAERLQLGLGEVGHRLHRPLRAVLVAQVHVQRRREHVAQHRQREDGEEGDERDDVADPPPLVPRVERRRPTSRRRACSAASRRSSTSRSPCSRRHRSPAGRCGTSRRRSR